jgi:hypothetical protein
VSENGRSRTGEIKRTTGGWAIRWRDARDIRRQKGGFRTKGEAKLALDDELRKARLGPLSSTTGDHASGHLRSKRPASTTGASTACATPSRRGAWRPA